MTAPVPVVDAHLVVHHPGFTVETRFQVASGHVLALLGPNGAGKSTVLRALAGLLPAQGHLRVDGVDLLSVPAERRPVGFVFQDFLLFPHLTVVENVAFGPRCQGMPARQARRLALDLLTDMGVAEYARARPRTRVLGHPHVGEQVEREPAGLPRGHALAARAECHVLHHGQVGEQEKVLEHETDRAPLRGHGQQVDPVHPQVSLRGEQPGQGAQHRGLSRTVRAEQRQHVAGRHLEAGFHGETGMVDDQVGVHDGDGRGHRAPSQWSRSTTRMRTETASSTRLSTTAASGLRCISKYTASGIVWVRPG